MRTPQLATRCLRILAVPLLLARLIARVWGWRGRSRALIVAAVSMLLALGLSAAPVAAVTTSITLKPGFGPPTSKVSVTGSGFGASETVAVDFGATPVAIATTSSTGTFTATFPVSKSTLPGSHPVTATGDTSGRSATSSFLLRADWAEFRFGPANTGYNPYENVIGPSNVAGLKTAWTGVTGTVQGDVVTSSPAVANGVAYIGSADSQAASKLYAFSAAGTTGCSGTRKTCKPLWTGTIQPFGNYIVSSPAVANGVVYVGSEDGIFYAFSAAGTTGCSGTPKTCKPLWTATTRGAIESSPAVVNGVVYIGSDDTKLYAFSAAGTTDCSGTRKRCKPLWTGTTGATGGPIGYSSPAVANGMVYVGSGASGGGKLYAFSAAGTTNCSGTPKTCKPLWTAVTDDASFWTSPAVANGVVYIGSELHTLYAFSAAGTTNCSGIPDEDLQAAVARGRARRIHVARGRQRGGLHRVGTQRPRCLQHGQHQQLLRDRDQDLQAAVDRDYAASQPGLRTPVVARRGQRGGLRRGRQLPPVRVQRGRHHQLLRDTQDLQAAMGRGHQGRPLLGARGGQRGGLHRVERRPFVRLQPVVPARQPLAVTGLADGKRAANGSPDPDAGPARSRSAMKS